MEPMTLYTTREAMNVIQNSIPGTSNQEAANIVHKLTPFAMMQSGDEDCFPLFNTPIYTPADVFNAIRDLKKGG